MLSFQALYKHRNRFIEKGRTWHYVLPLLLSETYLIIIYKINTWVKKSLYIFG